jgi:hypothetical protein
VRQAAEQGDLFWFINEIARQKWEEDVRMGTAKNTSPDFPNTKGMLRYQASASRQPSPGLYLGAFIEDEVDTESTLAQGPISAPEHIPVPGLVVGSELHAAAQPAARLELASGPEVSARPVDEDVGPVPELKPRWTRKQLARRHFPKRRRDILRRKTRPEHNRVEKNRKLRKKVAAPLQPAVVAKFYDTIMRIASRSGGCVEPSPSRARPLQQPARRSSAIFTPPVAPESPNSNG